MRDPGKRGSDDRAARPDEKEPLAVAAHLASRRRLLEEQFTRWIQESPQREDIADVAGRLLERFSEDALADLLIVAERMPSSEAPGWVRQQFDGAIGAFGTALRAAIPPSRRHQAAQILQLRLLEAERRLGAGLERWSKTH